MASSIEKTVGPLTTEQKEKVLRKIEDEIEFFCGAFVAVIRAIEKNYGEKGKDLMRKGFIAWSVENSRRMAEEAEKDDLQTYGDLIESAGTGTHELDRITDEGNRIGYRITRCMWAEKFRELDAADVGKWFCDSDEPCSKAFNSRMQFKRTKTLMDGDNICDHVYCLSEDA